MRSAFVHRKPWATVVLAILLGPAVVMFYLGRARAGLIYLAIQFLFSPVVLIGIPHSYFVARRQGGMRPTVWHGRFRGLIVILVLSNLTIGQGGRALLWEPFEAYAGSMRPSLAVGDRFFVSKFAYGYSRYSFPFAMVPFEGRIWENSVERGDIAVFRNPRDVWTDYIKRIVGLPGDRIQVKQGILHINGKPVKRERIEDFIGDRGAGAPQYIETLPNGRVHRILEEYGDKGRLDNTAEFVVPDGHYFALGDNRDNSADSRIIGFIPSTNLIGRLSVVFWNSRDLKLDWSTPD